MYIHGWHGHSHHGYLTPMGSQCLIKLLLLPLVCAIAHIGSCLYVLPWQLGATCSECITYVHPPNHLFHVQVYSLFVCFGQLLPAGDGGGGGGEGGGSVADVATREEESQTGSGGKWVGWGELVPLPFNMYICRGSTSICALLRQCS